MTTALRIMRMQIEMASENKTRARGYGRHCSGRRWWIRRLNYLRTIEGASACAALCVLAYMAAFFWRAAQ